MIEVSTTSSAVLDLIGTGPEVNEQQTGSSTPRLNCLMTFRRHLTGSCRSGSFLGNSLPGLEFNHMELLGKFARRCSRPLVTNLLS